jgi:hypothetical protein
MNHSITLYVPRWPMIDYRNGEFGYDRQAAV